MAEANAKKPEQSASDDRADKPKRRIIRKSAPTVREKAAAETRKREQASPGVVRLALRYITWPLRFIGRQLARLGRLLNKYKVFRVIGYIFVPPYFRSSWRELKQVTWPTTRDTWKLTFAVIVFSAMFGIIIMAVDYGLDKIFRKVLL